MTHGFGLFLRQGRVIKYQEVCGGVGGGTGAPGITYTEVSTYAQRSYVCMYGCICDASLTRNTAELFPAHVGLFTQFTC